MARLLENVQPIRRTLLLALLASVIAAQMQSQAKAAGATAAEPSADAGQSSPESKQLLPVDPKAEVPPAASPNESREAQIEAGTKKLFQLSAELRAEVAKTYKESLSLSVLKKAEEIEKLAKSLKVLMSKDAGATRH